MGRTGEPPRTFHDTESRQHTAGYNPRNRRSSAPIIQRMAAGFSQPTHAVGYSVQSTAELSTWSRRDSEPVVPSSTHLRNTEDFGIQLEEEVEEDKENEAPSRSLKKWESGADIFPWQFKEHDTPTSQATGSSHSTCRKLNNEVNIEPQNGLTDSSTSQSVMKKTLATNQAIEMSKDIICGICMDKIYEKTPPKDRCFAILPGCNHAFCLTCIKTWRHSKGFTNNILKACPECRVVSSYYIPHRVWVVDEQKQELIDRFKAEKRKIRCKFFLQSNGKCPFKSECIYLHEFPEGYRPPRHQPRRRNNHPSFEFTWNDDYDEEDDLDRALQLFGVLSLDFLENAGFFYELFDSDLSDFSLEDDFDSSDDD